MVSHDASRVGLLTVRRRSLTACGVPPVGPIPHVFQGLSVYGAVAPTTGERGCWERPSRRAERFHLVIDALAQVFPARLNLLRLDHRSAHTAQGLRWPEHVRSGWLPPYGPELSPIERVWRDVKEAIAWRQFSDIDAQQNAVGHLLCAVEATALPSLPGYAYLVEAINALCP